jgi:hypothetical protein
MVEIKQLYFGSPKHSIVAGTVLDALEDAGIFRVEYLSDETYCVHKVGEPSWAAELTLEQLHQLADELKALADT